MVQHRLFNVDAVAGVYYRGIGFGKSDFQDAIREFGFDAVFMNVADDELAAEGAAGPFLANVVLVIVFFFIFLVVLGGNGQDVVVVGDVYFFFSYARQIGSDQIGLVCILDIDLRQVHLRHA